MAGVDGGQMGNSSAYQMTSNMDYSSVNGRQTSSMNSSSGTFPKFMNKLSI